MKSKLIGVFGASGFGREVMPLVRQQVGVSDEIFVFVDDNPPSDTLNGHNVLTYDQFIGYDAREKSMTIAIADSRIREELTERCFADRILMLSVTSANAVILDQVEMGLGSILCSNTTITSNVLIGKAFHCNIYSYVAHDCVIGDFVTFAPSVKCNGNVVVEDHAYIGTGAIIKQGTPSNPIIIGKGAVIGMGAVVTKNVTTDETDARKVRGVTITSSPKPTPNAFKAKSNASVPLPNATAYLESDQTANSFSNSRDSWPVQ